MTFCKSLNGLIIGKCFLTQILKYWPKRFYFQEKAKYKVIQPKKLNFKQHIDHVIRKKKQRYIGNKKNSDIIYHENHYLQYRELF